MKSDHWTTRVTDLFGIRWPIVQGGMVWASGWRLAAAVSENGGLGLLGAGSMKPDFLRESIRKARNATARPLGVNIPLLRGDAGELIATALDEQVRIIFTSAGSPKKWTVMLQEAGCTVVHVAPSVALAQKAEAAGVNAVVLEGTEAGGHNGLQEIPLFSLLAEGRMRLKIPVIAAGGIVNGFGIMAALALGTDGVQMGTRFAATLESSAHEKYKQAIVNSGEGDARLAMKGVAPTRFLHNPLMDELDRIARKQPATLTELLKQKQEMHGILEGDLENGMPEMGTGSSLIEDIPAVAELIPRLITEAEKSLGRLRFALGG